MKENSWNSKDTGNLTRAYLENISYPHTVRMGGVQIYKEMADADAGECKGDDKMTNKTTQNIWCISAHKCLRIQIKEEKSFLYVTS